MKGRPSGLILLIAAIAAFAAMGIIPAMIADKSEQPAAVPAAPARAASRARPPGPAPAGKVWSAEHGHWHDAAPATAPVQVNVPPVQSGGQPLLATTSTPKPQPPGPVPAGKVWSPQHGHWHDAPRR